MLVAKMDGHDRGAKVHNARTDTVTLELICVLRSLRLVSQTLALMSILGRYSRSV